MVYDHYLLGPKGKFTFTINESENTNYKICISNTKGNEDNHLKEIDIRLVVNSDNMDDPDVSKSISTTDINPVKDKLAKAISKVYILI